jgi:hypothetical protein
MKCGLGVAIGIRPPSRTNPSGLLKNEVFVPEGPDEGSDSTELVEVRARGAWDG